MTLADRIVSDAANVFLQSGHFAETVTYYPQRYGLTQSPRSIQAVVVRNQVSSFNPDEQIVPEFEVRVANDSTTGISSTELNTGGDRIKLAVKVGGEQTLRSIQTLIEQDEGMLVLLCR